MGYSKNTKIIGGNYSYHFELLDSSHEASFLLMRAYQDLWLFPCEVSAKCQNSVQKTWHMVIPLHLAAKRREHKETSFKYFIN